MPANKHRDRAKAFKHIGIGINIKNNNIEQLVRRQQLDFKKKNNT